MTRDFVNSNRTFLAMTQATVTASAAGLPIDTNGSEGGAIWVYLAKSGDTLSPTVNFELDLQDSPDGVTWLPVTDALTIVPRPQAPNPLAANGYGIGIANGALNIGCFALINNPAQLGASATIPATTFGVSYFGINRYLRVSVVATGVMATGTLMFAVATLGYPHYGSVWGNIT